MCDEESDLYKDTDISYNTSNFDDYDINEPYMSSSYECFDDCDDCYMNDTCKLCGDVS